MNVKKDHDIKSAIRFLENLYQEIILSKDIKELQDPSILKQFRQKIEFLEKILSS